MKILDLLENLVSTDIVDKKYNGVLKHSQPDRLNNKLLGYGSYSQVRDDKTDPHTVKKNNYRPLKNQEGFGIFARYIAEPGKNRMDNIHIPKVYKIGKYTDRNGKHIDSYKIERLSSLKSATEKELEHMVNSIFNLDSEYITNLLRYERESNDKPSFILLYDAVIISQLITDAVEDDGVMDEIIKSDEMKEAIEIIRGSLDLSHERGRNMGLDIHHENIMMRKTPYGGQIVFSDPIFDSSEI